MTDADTGDAADAADGTADESADAAADPAPDADAGAGGGEATAEAVTELAKRRGFFFPTAESYGGVAGFYTFGPEGATLKRNVESAWRERFAVGEGHREIDAPTVMPEPVFEASGHLETFDDMLVECAECGASHRADHLIEDDPETGHEEAESLPIPEVERVVAEYAIACPSCGAELAGLPVEEFNLMFETTIGPGSGSPGYLRPETAQGIFVEFPRLSEYARNQLPFGITQVGRAYRNEISPRKTILRVREFTQAELELFVDLRLYPATAQAADAGDDGGDHDADGDGDGRDAGHDADGDAGHDADGDAGHDAAHDADGDADGVRETTVRAAVEEGIIDDPWIAYYLGVAARWYRSVGVDPDRFRFRQHRPGELSHYAADCWDAEGEVDGDWIELAGFAYRGDYDLSKHDAHSEGRYTVFKQYDEPRTVERPTVDPDMSYLGPEYGAAAADVADALETLAERDPGAFEAAGEDGTVTVTVGGDGDGDGEATGEGETHEVPVEHTGFAVEEVTENGEHVTPHVVEPSFGVDRLVYVLIDHAYREDVVDGEGRTYLELSPAVAPTFVGVFPLTDEGDLPDRARSIAEDLRAAGHSVAYDDSGNIGRRYRRQDEVGTPFCVTVDHRTPEDGRATLRDRDSTDQVRVPVEDLVGVLDDLRAGDRQFADLAGTYEAVGAADD